jgi:hypothetical protein
VEDFTKDELEKQGDMKFEQRSGGTNDGKTAGAADTTFNRESYKRVGPGACMMWNEEHRMMMMLPILSLPCSKLAGFETTGELHEHLFAMWRLEHGIWNPTTDEKQVAMAGMLNFLGTQDANFAKRHPEIVQAWNGKFVDKTTTPAVVSSGG